ncbi:hypothetical protein, partial [Pseudomonas sp. D4002]|uniref:hypothetical protein n=1 Tax=Pseudomonas sp. D4002 TaxID=2738817 RepID=UPI001C42F6D8
METPWLRFCQGFSKGCAMGRRAAFAGITGLGSDEKTTVAGTSVEKATARLLEEWLCVAAAEPW